MNYTNIFVIYFSALFVKSHCIPLTKPRCTLPEVELIITKYNAMIYKPELMARYNYFKLFDRTFPNPDADREFELELLQNWLMKPVYFDIFELIEMVKKRADMKELNIEQFEHETTEMTIHELNKAANYILNELPGIDLGPIVEDEIMKIFEQLPNYAMAMLEQEDCAEKLSMAVTLLGYLENIRTPMNFDLLLYQSLLLNKSGIYNDIANRTSINYATRISGVNIDPPPPPTRDDEDYNLFL